MATTGLQVHRAERTDLLADALGDLLADPLPDPFDTEIVVVSALGMERWLAQRLSHRLGTGPGGTDGVCAGVRFARPRALVSELSRPVDAPAHWRDPWEPERLLWPIAETIDACLDEPWCRQLARHLGAELTGPDQRVRRARRLGVARRLARLLHGYALQRPAMTAAWTAGEDHDASRPDGTGEPLPATAAWQAELWRRVRQVVTAPSPDERLAAAAERAREHPATLRGVLPARISLFGHNRLPLGELTLLAALAEHHAVHLWLPHPSPRLWQQTSGVVVRRADVPPPGDDDHRLLASLATDVRELQRGLAQVAPGARYDVLGPADRPATLLGRLQRDLVAGAAVASTVEPDDTVQVHACHGPARQVEVLRDVLVGLLADDPTLEPRDIVVMCPDIDRYAPLIQAAFGLADTVVGGHPGHRLRVTLADRSAAASWPLLGTAITLLTLAARGRFTAGDVVDLLASDPVRLRFDLDEDDLDRVSGWVEQTSVRWGLDGEHRRGFGLTLGQNTWRAGIDRIVAGVAASERADASIGDVLPLDDVASNDISLAGRLADALELLGAAADRLATAQSAGQWAAALDAAVTSLTAVPEPDQWQVDRFHRELAELFTTSGETSPVLQPEEVLSLVRERWSGRAGRAGFRTGTLTVCTMVPMRAVPHRVVAMIGLDDGDFPRTGTTHGDDVLAIHPLTGEHDVRIEDRQLFLDAIMSATEHLVLCFTGADEQRGQPRPPAVPLGELLDQLRLTTGRSRDELVVDHPLQPFDVRNLQAGALVPHGAETVRHDRPFSFDPAALAGARALAGRRAPARTRLLGEPLGPPRAVADVGLTELTDLFVHPAKAFLRQRLGVSLPPAAGEIVESIPLEPDGLQAWAIGDRLLQDSLAGVDPMAAADAARRRGTLPPGRLGLELLERIGGVVGPLAAHTRDWREGEPRSIDVDVDVPGGRRLTGAVDGVYGTRLVTIGYSAIRARQLIRAWLRLVAVSAQDPDTPWTAQLAGRDRRSVSLVHLGPIRTGAADLLAELVELRDAGLLRPLPLPPELGLEFARNLSRGSRLQQATRMAYGRAKGSWESDRAGFGSEREDPENELVWGLRAPFQVLLDAGFADLAPRLWNPLIDHEQSGGRR